MTRLRAKSMVGNVLRAAVGLPALLAVVPVYAQSSTLDMPLDTGHAPTPTFASPVPPTRNAAALPSRGMPNFGASARQIPAVAPQVLAQLGTVLTANVSIRIAQDPHARILSVVAQGANLAVVAESGGYWGVLMVNNTMGWVPKATLQLMDYRTSVSVPASPAAAPVETPPSPASTGFAYYSGDRANLDPRTAVLLHEAFTYLGVPYVWAGNTRKRPGLLGLSL